MGFSAYLPDPTCLAYPFPYKLCPRKEESLLRFHPWVFSGAIASIDGSPRDGDLVEVLDSRGRALGTGHYALGSIAVRMLSFDSQETIDQEFYQHRLRAALKLRASMGLIRPEKEGNFKI